MKNDQNPTTAHNTITTARRPDNIRSSILVRGRSIRLLKAFEGTYEGPLEHYLGCKIARDPITCTTTLSQKHYAEEILRSHGFWDIPPQNTPMKPKTRLSKDNCDPNHKQDFHRRYRGIVGSLGYPVTMTRPDLAWSYSELSKYVQFPGIAHMEAAGHVL